MCVCVIIALQTSHAQENDTLKIKVTEMFYFNPANLTAPIGELDGAIINMDLLPIIKIGVVITNVSNDTYFQNERLGFYGTLFVYTDTGDSLSSNISRNVNLSEPFYPNNSMGFADISTFDFPTLISQIKGAGIDFEEITHWKLIYGVDYTDRDGAFTNRVFLLSASTATFYLTKTPPPSILETTQAEISVFPNPAQSHFTVTNTANANLSLYNVLGQQVKQVVGEGENTIIYTEDVPQGIYLLKIEKGDAVHTKKIQISK